jgi:hypothetical protein
MHDFILKHNPGLHNFFPPDHFKGAFAPLINIQMHGLQAEEIKVDVHNNHFSNQ